MHVRVLESVLVHSAEFAEAVVRNDVLGVPLVHARNPAEGLADPDWLDVSVDASKVALFSVLCLGLVRRLTILVPVVWGERCLPLRVLREYLKVWAGMWSII